MSYPATGKAWQGSSMAYHHVLVRRAAGPADFTLVFKDLSEQALRASFVEPFLAGGDIPLGPVTLSRSAVRATIIRTRRPHDAEVTDYLRAWGEKAEEFMRSSGYPVNAQPMGDSAIAGAGEDVTAEFLQPPAQPGRTESVEEARRRIENWARNNVSITQVVRILALVNEPPDFRSTPRAGDRRDRHFDAWFDGGAIVQPTGGLAEYWFDDGVRVKWPGLGPRLGVEIQWPDGRTVSIRQESDLSGFVENLPPPAVQAGPQDPGGGIATEIARGRMPYYRSAGHGRDDKVVTTILKGSLGDDAVRRRFRCLRREARAAERVTHPNIVQVLYSGDEDDVIFLAKEHIDGRDLQSRFDANERFTTGEAVILMGDLCAALHAAHEAGIVHCNVTPENVIIGADGCAKLADFGLARFDGADAAENEPDPDPGKTSELVGTPAYMSPEAISGAQIDRRADIFSAGAVLYQLLTGRMPFAGPGTWTTARQVLEEDPPPASSLDKDLSPLFDAVVGKALAKNPEDRYQTALELDVALQEAMWKSGPGSLQEEPTQTRSIGRYRIVRELAGEYTALYAAHDPALDRLVQVAAVSRAERGPEDYAEILKGFRRHAHVAGRLEHPGIVPAHEAGESEGMAYLVTAPTRAGTLKARMQESVAWPYPEATRVVSGLLDVLDFVHRNGIVHRNVKPADVLLETDGRVRLADFSLCLFLHPAEPVEQEEEGMLVGTPAYMSPEQIAGRPLDGRSDLFAVGIILYTLLTGRRPFSGAAGRPVAGSILNETPEPPSVANPALPAACDAVVMKALAKDPQSRHATAAEFGLALRSAVGAEPEMAEFIGARKVLTFYCTDCAGSPFDFGQYNRDNREAWRRYGAARPTHCVRCGKVIELYPRPYTCWDCGNEWEVGFSEFELGHSLDDGRVDACGRCGQRVGAGHHACRQCGREYEIELGHWHVGCDVWSHRCPACGGEESSLCVC